VVFKTLLGPLHACALSVCRPPKMLRTSSVGIKLRLDTNKLA